MVGGEECRHASCHDFLMVQLWDGTQHPGCGGFLLPSAVPWRWPAGMLSFLPTVVGPSLGRKPGKSGAASPTHSVAAFHACPVLDEFSFQGNTWHRCSVLFPSWNRPERSALSSFFKGPRTVF